MGLGPIEIIIVLLVIGGLVFALRGRPAARTWILGGLAGALVGGMALWMVGFAVTTRVEHRVGNPHYPAQNRAGAPYDFDTRLLVDSSGEKSAVRAPRPENREPLPGWITDDHNNSAHVVAGAQYADRGQAIADALNKARLLVANKLQALNPDIDGWWPHPDNIKRTAIEKRHTEAIVRTTGDHDFTVYRTYLLVDVSPTTLAVFESVWREETKGARAVQVGAIALVLTGIFGLLAGFFRLDDRTRGRYRWPLVGATVVGVSLLAAVLPVVAGDAAEIHKDWFSEKKSGPTVQEAVPLEAPRPIHVAPPQSCPENPYRYIGY